MPRSNASSDDDIIFEDLHGVSDDENTTMEVDLDAKEGEGITRHARTSSDDGESTGYAEDFGDIDYGTDDDVTINDDSDDGGEDDTTGDRFSKKFENRLKREQRAKRKEREGREQAERENARLRKQLKKSRKTDTEAEDRDRVKQIESIEADLEEAVEAGDSKKQVRLTSQLTDAKAERIAARYTVNDDDDDDLVEDDSRSTSSPPVQNELVSEWKDTHGDWYGRKGFERQTRLANRIDREVFSEGFDPSEEDYYEELDRRLKEKVPDVFNDEGDPDTRTTNRRAQKQPRRDKGRSPVASADDASRDSAPRQQNMGTKVSLGAREFDNMRRFGLDPKNPAHVKEYALNKRQADAEENARG